MLETQTGTTQARRRKIFYGWWMVAAGAFNTFYLSWIQTYGLSAFFLPILTSFGSSRAAVAGAFSLQRLEGAVAAPFIGYFVDRFGPRPSLIIGSIITSAGFFALSFTTGILTFYLAFILLAIGSSLGSLMPKSVAINIWFNRYRARAMAVLTIAMGLGGLGTPIIIWMIDEFGWRWALRIMATGVLLVGLPVAMVFRHRPEDYGYLPDGDLPAEGQPLPTPRARGAKRPKKRMYTFQALRMPLFWKLSLGLGIWSMTNAAFLTHAIPLFSSKGLSQTQAGLAVSGTVVVLLMARGLFGLFGHKVNKQILMAIAMGVFAVSSFIFFLPINGFIPVAAFAIGYGVGHGLYAIVRFVIVADYFGRNALGELSGLMNTMSVIFGVISPVLVGRWADITGGDYRFAVLCLGISSLVIIPFFLTLKKPLVRLGEE